MNLQNTDPHVVATIIKMYIKEMPESVVPVDMYENFVQLKGEFIIDQNMYCLAPGKGLSKEIVKEVQYCTYSVELPGIGMAL